jgi:nitrite reductase (NO-forming)
MTHETIEIANGVKYTGWTFGHTVPGPVIRVRQGDLVRITLVNLAKDMPHSIDFHASKIPMNHAMKSIGPRDSLQFEFEATTPGTFMVHCGTPPVLMHIAQGMYLPIIVDPKGGWPTKADKEFILVQSDFYPKGSVSDSTLMEGDWDAMLNGKATYVVFNGKAFQYKDAPLQVEEGDRVRLFVMNAGPNLRSDFHVVGNIFDRVYPGGNPAQVIDEVQTYTVPTGGGAVFELTFQKGQAGNGTYAFVTHAFADASKGAVGLIQVGKPAIMAGH